jgi:hypothetical protein
MMNPGGKEFFYPKIREALESCGYKVFDDIRGRGRSHASKPDYIAVKGSTIVIGEIKSPSEGPLSASWRSPQDSDTPEFSAVRLEVAAREKKGIISREAGGHEIIIQGQIPDYVRKLRTTYDLPARCSNKGKVFCGYSAPVKEAKDIEQAFSNCGKRYFGKILHNGTVTYLFSP